MGKKKKPTVIELFAGCGGLSLGLHNAGWQGLFAVEKNQDAFKTLEYNLINKKKHFCWPEWLPQSAHDINKTIRAYEEKLKLLRGKVTLIAGGPPCQGFSIAGRRNEKDDRNNLIKSYVKFVSLIQPKLLFFENVKGFTMEFKNNAEKGKKYSEIVLKKLNEQGYFVCGKLINFGDYGIPQKRTRFILVGMRKNIKGANVKKVQLFFKRLEEQKFNFLNKKQLVVNPTIKEALSDLLTNTNVETPDRKGFQSSTYKIAVSSYQKYMRKKTSVIIPNSHSFAKHTQKIIDRLKYILEVSTECKNLKDDLKEQLGITKQVLVPLKADKQSPTITSNPDDLIHYLEPRILTVREYARLQSFPDDFEFQGKYTTGGVRRRKEVPRYTQIGNAIPPLFGEQSGMILKQMVSYGK
jgi:DNA (cytosine-5)-methyltransferase 1